MYEKSLWNDALFFFPIPPLAPQAATFDEKVALVYDTAPKVRIAGSGFDTLDADNLKLSFAPKLKVKKDYTVAIQSSSVMVLTLKPKKK